MPIVKLSFGERFLNWYANNTKLYIAGQRGKDFKFQREQERVLAKQLNKWFESLDEIKELRDRQQEDWPWDECAPEDYNAQ